MVQLLNIIDLQIGKVVTSLSGLHNKFPSVPPVSLAGTPAPGATLFLLDYAAGPIS